MKQRIQTLIENADGLVDGVDRAKMTEVPFHFVTNPPSEQVAMGANQSSAPLITTVSGEGPAEIDTMAVRRTAVCLVTLRIMDGNTARTLMNGRIHVDTIFGSGRQPFRLPESLYIDEKRALVSVFTDISGGVNTARPAFHASRYLREIYDPHLKVVAHRLQQRQYWSMPYFYTFDQSPQVLGIGATAQATISIGTDHHFEAWKISGVSTGPFDLNITDLTTGETIVDAFGSTTRPVSNGLIVGTANFPFNLQEPRFYSKGTKLIVDLVNRHGAPNTIFLTITGRALADQMWRTPADAVANAEMPDGR